jgi:D-glycero-beta-D-manno-heptose-7-phosphate kinase
MKKILLLGDSCTDIFIYGDCYKLNPEAPTPVFSESYRNEYPGMCGNVLKNIQSLGLDADLLTQNKQILKTRYVDKKSNYILLRLDNDSDDHHESIKDIKKININSYDLVIISDYDKGFLSEDDLKYIFENSKLSFIDTKKAINKWIIKASFIKINEAEYANPKNNMNIMNTYLKNKLIVTMGESGAKYKDVMYKPVKEVLVRDVVGAGDSFLASLACHYLLHNNIENAITFANLCAGQVVSKKGIGYPDEKLV